MIARRTSSLRPTMTSGENNDRRTDIARWLLAYLTNGAAKEGEVQFATDVTWV